MGRLILAWSSPWKEKPHNYDILKQMREIRIGNPVLNSYVADLAADYSSGLSVTLRSNNSFSPSDLAVFGNPTEELTELKKILALVGITGVTLDSTLNFQHNKGTPVYKTLWDFVEIQGAPSSISSFTVLTLSPIQWDSKSSRTIYFHSTGTDAWQYKFRFYNSVTNTYSEYSPTLVGSGLTRFQAGYIIKQAREKARDVGGKAMTTDELLEELTAAKYNIQAHNAKYWFWKVNGFNSGVSIPALTTTSVYSFSSISNFNDLDSIEYKYTNGATIERYMLRKKTDSEFLSNVRNANRPANDFPRIFRLLPPDANSTKGYFEVETPLQNSGVGVFYINYYKDEPDFTGIDSATSVIIPEILRDYLIASIYASKGNDAMFDKYMDRFTGPQNRKKTQGIVRLSGIALLDELDRQHKVSQGQPKSVWNFRGQKAMTRLFGSRRINNPDYVRENYFDGVD